MCLFLKKFEYSPENVKLIAQCIAYFWETAEDDEVDLKVFQAMNELRIGKLLRRHPILCADPIQYYLDGCKLFGDYTPEQRELVATSDPSIWRCEVRDLTRWLEWGINQPLYKYLFNNIKYRVLCIWWNFRHFE